MGLGDRLRNLDNNTSWVAALMESSDEAGSPAAREARRVRSDARRTRQARLAIRYGLGLTVVLVVLAVVVAAGGDTDTASLCLGMAVVSALASGARYAVAKWAGRV